MLKFKIKSPVSGIFLVLFYFTTVSDSSANKEQEYKSSVEDISNQIKSLSKSLNTSKALLKNESDKLSELEQEIHTLSKSTKQTEELINQQKKQNRLIEDQLAKLEESQNEDKMALAKLVKERYMQGQPNFIQMVLNQKNPYAVGRLNNYYKYFSIAQNEKLSAIRSKLESTKRLKEQLDDNLLALNTQQQQQADQRSALAQARKKRQTSVTELNQKIEDNSSKLSRLKQDRDRLNTLISEIRKQAEKLRKLQQQRLAEEELAAQQRQLKNQQEAGTANNKKPTKRVERPLVKGGFLKQKGRLNYPVPGKAKYRFGSRLAESGMRSQGVFFDTKGGQAIKAIFRGRVLFADYLKGYGLLLIVDHGDDHISLYGHNEVLYKKVGDNVSTNEVIALTGVSGGLKSHGLYFEIRKSATPIDPGKWCR